jgi:hypothetical protein
MLEGILRSDALHSAEEVCFLKLLEVPDILPAGTSSIPESSAIETSAPTTEDVCNKVFGNPSNRSMRAARTVWCQSACKFGSDSLLMQFGGCLAL